MTRRDFLALGAAAGAGLALLPHWGWAAQPTDEFPATDLKAADFGPDFIWGVATAAYQIEGAWNADGKGPGIWDVFLRRKGKDTGEVAADHYNRYREDVALLGELGIPHYRYSISWPRVLPQGTGTPNPKGLDFYDRLTDELLKRNITPWVTLYHWDLPQALHERGGWANRDVLNWFSDYITLMVNRLGDRVPNWMIFNEPAVFTVLGYLYGYHAPGRRGLRHFLPATHHVNLAMADGLRLVKSLRPNARVGTTFNLAPIDPVRDTPLHREAAARGDVFYNRLFTEPLHGLGYPVDAMPELRQLERYHLPGDADRLKAPADFIGVQNYSRLVFRHLRLFRLLHGIPTFPKLPDRQPMPLKYLEYYPEGMYRVLKRTAALPGLKQLIVTENGASYPDRVENGRVHDADRIRFLQAYLAQVRRAQREGAPIGGYFVWSFLDNLEWRDGYEGRYGIVYVDYATQQRYAKDSARWYGKWIRG